MLCTLQSGVNRINIVEIFEEPQIITDTRIQRRTEIIQTCQHLGLLEHFAAAEIARGGAAAAPLHHCFNIVRIILN